MRGGERESGRVALLAIAGVVLIVVVGGGVALAFRGEKPPRPVRIATGGKGGTYLTLGQGLAEVLSREVRGVRAEAIETAGSADNMDRLERGEVEMALVQNDTPGGGAVRSIAPLYDEVLHVVVRADAGIDDALDLAGKRVAIGQAKSGTEALVRSVFGHFGILPRIDARSLGTAAAIEAFEKGELDAACFLSGLKSPAAERLLSGGRARLLALGDAARAGSSLEGVRVEFPYVSPAIIPARSYGPVPSEPVGTIAVRAVLVASRDLEPALVREITRALFASKVRLTEHHKVMGRLTERFDPSELRFPLHHGADAYYSRDKPAFFVEYAEAISLGITVAVGIGSALLAAREWLKRTKKNRIDVFYVEVDRVAQDLARSGDATDIVALRDKLLALRRKAFEDLIAETLAADESFTIFQDFLRSELSEVERRIEERKRVSGERAAAEAKA